MSQLPNAANATIDDLKITGYLLKIDHPQGAGKAKFLNSYGYDLTNWQALKAALLNHPLTNSVSGNATTAHGDKYVVTCSVDTPDRRNPCIASIWIIEPANPDPRFVTAYPHP